MAQGDLLNHPTRVSGKLPSGERRIRELINYQKQRESRWVVVVRGRRMISTIEWLVGGSGPSGVGGRKSHSSTGWADKLCLPLLV